MFTLCALVPAILSTPRKGEADPTWRFYAIPQFLYPVSIYDVDHRRMLVVGPIDGGDVHATVWSTPLDSAQHWAPLSTHGEPPDVRLTGGILDPLRNRLVVWGGNGAFSRSGTWAFSLSDFTWSRILTYGPNASGSGVVYDAANDRALVLCGISYSSLGSPYDGNDVVSLDLSGPPAWTTLTPAGRIPPGRGYVAAIYDAPRHRVIMHGGKYVAGYPYAFLPLDETWELAVDGTPTWRFLPPSGVIPQARSGHVAVWDSVADRMLIEGGQNIAGASFHSDLWSLDLSDPDSARWIRDPVAGPGPERYPTNTILDPLRRQLVWAGGDSVVRVGADAVRLRAGGRFALELPPSPTWSQVVPDVEVPTGGGTVVHDVRRNRIVSMNPVRTGGTNITIWSGAIGQPPGWIGVGPNGPEDQQDAVLVSDSLRDQFVAYDGFGPGRFYFAPGVWGGLGVTGTPPPVRSRHTMVYDPGADRMIVYGGEGTTPNGHPVIFDDMWALTMTEPAVWAKIEPIGPTPPGRAGHEAVLDVAGRRMLIFAGHDTLHAFNDLWSFSLDSLTWRQWFPSGASPGSGVWLYDANHQRILVVRPKLYPATGPELFALSLDGSPTWSQLSTQGTGPVAEYSEFQGLSGYYDAGRDIVVVLRTGSPEQLSAPAIWALYPGDWTTVVEVSVAEASADVRGVHIRWSLAAGSMTGVIVERRSAASAWEHIADLVPDAAGQLILDDSGVAPGRSYDYRLLVSGIQHAGEVTVVVPPASRALTAFPNPASGEAKVHLFLPMVPGARIEVFDAAGRRRADLPVPSSAALPVEVSWSLSNMPPGVYLLRLVSGHRVLGSTRLAVVR